MGKPDAPDPPDYTEIAEASEYAADLSFQIAQDQLAWAMEQYEAGLEITEPVIDELLETMTFTNDIAEADRLRYEEQYQALEDELIAEAESYATPQRIELEMGRAQAGVAEQTNAAREAAEMSLESYGINPADVRYASLDVDTRTDAAAAGAAAGQQAMLQAEAKGDALRSEAINIGKGYPGYIQSAYNTSLSAGTGAAATQNAATSTASNALTQPASYMATGTEALSVWGNTINTGYQNELSAYNAQMSAMSGIGTALGTIGGLVLMAEEGGEVPDPRRYSYQGGGPLLRSQSPSRGARPDDIPINAEAGEFMVDKETAAWLGTKKLYEMQEKAHEEIAERRGAVPASPGRSPNMHQQMAMARPHQGGGQPMRRPTQSMQPGMPAPAPGRGAIPPMPRGAPRAGAGALPVGRGSYMAAAGGEVPRRPLNMQAGGEVDPNYYPVGVDPGSGAYFDPATGQWVIPAAAVPGAPAPVAPVQPALRSNPYRSAPTQAVADTGGGLFGGLAEGLSAGAQTARQAEYARTVQPGSLSTLIAPTPRGVSTVGVAPAYAAAGEAVVQDPAPVSGATAAVAPGVVPAAARPVPARVPVTGATAAVAPGVVPAAARPVPARVPVTGATAAVAPGVVPAAARSVPPPFSAMDYSSPRRIEGRLPYSVSELQRREQTDTRLMRRPAAATARGGIEAQRAEQRGMPYSSATTGTEARTPRARPAAGGTTRSGEPARTPRARPPDAGQTGGAGRTVRPQEMRSRGDVTGREKPITPKRGQITAEPELGALSAESFARQGQDYMRRKKGKSRPAKEGAVPAAATAPKRQRGKRQRLDLAGKARRGIGNFFRRDEDDED